MDNRLHYAIESLRNNPSKVFLLDGGTGEELIRQGVPDDRKIWSAVAIKEKIYHPTVVKVHQSYIEAGADAITTNSYGIVPGVGFTKIDMGQYIETAGRLAKQAVRTSKRKTGTIILGSVPPLVESYRADLILPHEVGKSYYDIFIKALNPSVDAFLAETMSCVDETMQVLDALENSNSNKPLLVSFTIGSDGNMRNGKSLTSCLTQFLKDSSTYKTELVGILFNCCEPESITEALKMIKSDKELWNIIRDRKIILGAYANALTPVDPSWTLEQSTESQPTRDDLDPDAYLQFARLWHSQFGLQIIGGCCAIYPDHIRKLDETFQETRISKF